MLFLTNLMERNDFKWPEIVSSDDTGELVDRVIYHHINNFFLTNPK